LAADPTPGAIASKASARHHDVRLILSSLWFADTWQ
jgi:hypothetical protein